VAGERGRFKSVTVLVTDFGAAQTDFRFARQIREGVDPNRPGGYKQ
jgi:hypothetical protein